MESCAWVLPYGVRMSSTGKGPGPSGAYTSANRVAPSRIRTGMSRETETFPFRVIGGSSFACLPCMGGALSRGGRRVQDRERVAADRELAVAEAFRFGELPLGDRQDRLVDAAAHGLEGLEPLEDQAGVEVDVVLHAGRGVGVGRDLDHRDDRAPG